MDNLSNLEVEMDSFTEKLQATNDSTEQLNQSSLNESLNTNEYIHEDKEKQELFFSEVNDQALLLSIAKDQIILDSTVPVTIEEEEEEEVSSKAPPADFDFSELVDEMNNQLLKQLSAAEELAQSQSTVQPEGDISLQLKVTPDAILEQLLGISSNPTEIFDGSVQELGSTTPVLEPTSNTDKDVFEIVNVVDVTNEETMTIHDNASITEYTPQPWDDIEPETLYERFCGLSEMFPESLVNFTVKSTSNSYNFLLKSINVTKSVCWAVTSTMTIAVLPALMQIELARMEETHMAQQRQMFASSSMAQQGAGLQPVPIPGQSSSL